MTPLILIAAQVLTLPPELLEPVTPVPPPAPVLVFFLPPPPEPLPLLEPRRPEDAPPVLPEQIRAVVNAAVSSGDPAAVAAVVKFAKTTNPETAVQIDRINEAYLARVAARKAREAREKRDALMLAGPLDYWKGSIELGASRSTGNTDALGVYVGAAANRDGIDWRHKLTGRVDYQRTDGVTSTERFNAAYQPNYKINEQLYIYGIAQYERDRLLGYTTRLTAGGGIGYSVFRTGPIKLDLEGGPALRRTDYVELPEESGLAGRGSANLTWNVTPKLVLTQNASVYLEPDNRSATSSTALDTTIIGSLKARFSYNVQYERAAPTRNRSVDTLGRATLVYGF
ncbi:YdiY family protein [Sphingomonas arantia]|uniref:YdiY family protein n=1 Tax=Sphingomonas arantia TaxID=1460676 RepID=A0ABW4TXA0_9SPHN